MGDRRPVIAILPTVMRQAFDNATITPGCDPRTVKRCLGSLKTKAGKIHRRQMWYRCRSERDSIHQAVRT